MDPFDMPSTTTVVNCLDHWGTDSFADAFLTELTENENDLPLQSMCISGGHPSSDDWAELDDLQLDEEKDGSVTGSFAISFTEASPTGCRDMTWTDKRNGKITFTLNLETGEVEFDEPMLRREYDPEEF
jgi:hypothetical protein